MVDNNPPDPAKAFGDWVTQWERAFDSFANQVMGTEGYSQAMNEAQKAQLAIQKSFSQAMTHQLTTMNIPTREDVLRISEAIQSVERRLERIEQALVTKAAKKDKKSRSQVPRTKKPKSKSSEETK